MVEEAIPDAVIFVPVAFVNQRPVVVAVEIVPVVNTIEEPKRDVPVAMVK